MPLKVLIPTGGKGVDLGDITKYINKSLVKIGKKPALSYIIESYPKDTEFIVTTGYFGNQIKDFLKIVYPERNITIVEVDNYEGKGSSIIYSMSKAKDFLNGPFIYHAGDTIVLDDFIKENYNWVAGYKGLGSSNYAGFNTTGNNIDKLSEKGVINPNYIHIGLVYIKDYLDFWGIINELLNNNHDHNLNDISVINKMIYKGLNFSVNNVENWFDIGNVDGLNIARKEIPDSFHILDKLEESIYIYDDFVVKFFGNQELSDKRVRRAKLLKGLVPDIQGHENNFFRYRYAKGKLYSRSVTPSNFKLFFKWSKDNLWRKSDEVSKIDFKKVCYKFYYNKSIERVKNILESNNLKDEENIINGEKVPNIENIFKKIDFDWLCTSEQTFFHGDFILDNIIQTSDGFSLLDWRQDFGGLLQSGDMYYDLGKLNHNLTVNHDLVNADLFDIKKDGNIINVDINRRENLVQCQKVLHELILESGFDLRKVKILSAIIWLNMSPLHHHPFDKFLFYFGKLNLWRAINEKN